MQKKLKIKLNELFKLLKKEYPAHHRNYVSVWTKYWNLLKVIQKG